MWTAVGVDSKQLRASQGGAREAGGSTSAGCPGGLSLPRGGKLGMQPCPSPIRVIPHPDFALPSLRAMPLSSPLPPKLIPPSPAFLDASGLCTLLGLPHPRFSAPPRSPGSRFQTGWDLGCSASMWTHIFLRHRQQGNDKGLNVTLRT